MGAYIPGMDEHNAVNNSDGFSTGFLGNSNDNNFSPMSPQGFVNNNQQNFQNNQQNFQNNQQVPAGNFQSFSSANEQNTPTRGADQIQIISSVDDNKKMQMPDFPVNISNNIVNTNQMNVVNSEASFGNQNIQNSNSNNGGFSGPSQAPLGMIPGKIPEKKKDNDINLPPQLAMKIEEARKEEDKKTLPKEEKSEKDKSDDLVMDKIHGIIKKKENKSKKSEKKKSDKIIHIVALSIIGVLILFIVLYSTGVLKFNKNKPIPSPEQPTVDKEKEKIEEILVKLNGGCSNLSASGSYGTESISSDSECKNLVCFIEDKVICQNSICMIAIEDKVYTRVCETGEARVANKTDFQARLNLDLLCEMLNNSPNLNGNVQDEYGTCSNYECTTKVDGKEFNQTCQKNG